MKILALITDAFGSNGGIANYNRNLLYALCSNPVSKEVVVLPRKIHESEINLGSLPSKLKYEVTAANNKMRYLFELLKLRKDLHQFNLIICGHINLLPLTCLLSLRKKIPIYLVVYGVEAWQPQKLKSANYFLKKIDRFISISDVTKERFLSWSQLNPAKGVILPCTIDLSRFSSGHKSNILLNRYGLADKVVIMTLARLDGRERNKGIDEVMEIIPNVVNTIPNLAYLVIGDGSDRYRLQSKAVELGISERVVFTSRIPEEEKVEFYRLADAFVMAGRQEGFGIVYLEALACGIPVVASKLDGSREALRDGKLGILVNPDNLNELRDGILKALTAPKKISKEDLYYFSITCFEERVNNIISDVICNIDETG